MDKPDAYFGKTVNTVFNQEFIVDNRFTVVKELGHGAYGIVCLAKYDDGENTSYVAIKKITNIFSKTILCKRSLRELKLLQFFRGHKNITCLYDLDIIPNPTTGDFNEVYLYEELMECDMHQIIRSGQPLTDQHYQLFVYQILCGLKYIHLADVLHRDLKPGNLLVNADCDLKICDFGLARGFSENPEQNQGFLTEYVATRWYRAPEIMLSFTNYTKAIDVWSVGCILAELLGGKPLFRGKDYVDQLNQILLILGTPPEETLTKIGSVRAQNYVRSLPFMPRVKFTKLFPQANPMAIDLLEKMLTLDPYERITVEEALDHPYLSIWHEPQDEPECAMKFDFKSFEEVNDVAEMKKLIVEEVRSFREFVRKPLEEQQQIQLQQQLRQKEAQKQELQQQQQQQQQQLHHNLHLQQLQLQQPHMQLSDPHVNASEQRNQIHPHALEFSPQIPARQHQYEQFSLQLPLQQMASGNEFVDTSNLTADGASQFYQQMPRPQELSEFNFNSNPQEDTTDMTDTGNDDLFRLEEELGFGLDGLYLNSI